MTLLEALILGLVQGLTEFLPVSSSGHLALGQALLGVESGGGALFEVVVHVATALAIVTVYRSEFGKLLVAVPRSLNPSGLGLRYVTDPDVRMVWWLLASAVPAGVIGILFKDEVEGLFEQPRVVGGLLVLTGLWLLLLWRFRGGDRPMSLRIALIMGLVQAGAILPGISRSGATIGAGLLAGGRREEVGRFAFLMALIPIGGAALLKARDLGQEGSPSTLALLVGFAAAFVSGVFALKVLLAFVARGGLWLFAPYCLLAGALAIWLG